MPDVQAIHEYVQKEFPGFGLTKNQTVVRLLYEISRKIDTDFKMIIPRKIADSRDFFQVKSFLLGQRYPSLSSGDLERLPPFTELKISNRNQVDLSHKDRRVQTVVYEKELVASELLARLRHKLPGIPFHQVSSYAQYITQKPLSIEDYNTRYQTLFLINKVYGFFIDCPCSKPSRPCGYYILNAGMGCGFDCVYCYLQGYTNSPGMILPGNLDEILKKIPPFFKPGMRIGTGQFTDSLILDELTGFSSKIIRLFRDYPAVNFEFKTKSNNVGNILNEEASRNIVVSWSLNPQAIIDSAEFFTASLEERLTAAKQCAGAGYRVGFHFDPIIYYNGWEADYADVVDGIFRYVDQNDIAWISLGCLRMTVKARQVMEQRFPKSDLFLAEQVLGFDGKLRYADRRRKEIYRHMLDCIHRHSQELCVYLCMEDEAMNQELGIPEVCPCGN